VAMINSRPGIMLAPVTFNREIDSASFDSWPASLKSLLEKQALDCVHDTMKSQVEELARRCGNLSPEQLSRLYAYKIAVETALAGICLFYHCSRYQACYSPIKIIFDRTGRKNNREELVFKDIIFLWVSNNIFTSIKQIHTDDHPFVRLYGTHIEGRRAFDLGKIVRGNFDFQDSKDSWELQLTDMLTSAWINAVRDHNNYRGYLPVFSLLHRNTVLSADQPINMMSVADVSSEKSAPPIFNVYRHLAAAQGKVLPCKWEIS